MNITKQQAERATNAIEAYALKTTTSLELTKSRVAVSDSLGKHIARVERVLGCSYRSLSAHVQDLLEECRAVAGALAPAYKAHEWDGLDRDVWAIAQKAM